MGITCVGLYQVVTWGKKSLKMACNGFQVCLVMPSSSGEKKDWQWIVMGIRYVGFYQVAGQ